MNASREPLPAARAAVMALAGMASRWWNQLAIYFPVLLMGLLALGSYWVVSQSPAPAEPAPPRPVSAVPDYFMRDFAVRTFDAGGELKSQVRGSELRHFPATQTIEADDVRLHSVNPVGRVTTATARRLLTNDEQSLYTLSGDVVIIRQAHVLPDGQRLPRLEFRGETITYFVTEGRLESDQPALMLRDADRIQADRLRYSDDTRQAELQGRVRATLQPRL